MFKFFPDDDDDSDSVSKEGKEGKTNNVELNPCKEILISDFHNNLLNVLSNSSSNGGSTTVAEVKVWKAKMLKCVNLSELCGMDELFKEENVKVQKILRSATDLVPGEYEGGFKTWECTFDLITYLQEHCGDIFKKRQESDKNEGPLRILDMGCGSGLVGLASLCLAETLGVEVTVDLQDYNEEVINYVTIPNTLLNFQDEMASRCRFYFGDWDSFKEVVCCDPSQEKVDIQGQKYDLILSSETIYNLDYFPKFLGVIKSCLKEEGCLYLAAKTFYFGVGGGTKSFLNMVNEDNALEANVVHVIKHGVQREIICCKRRKSS